MSFVLLLKSLFFLKRPLCAHDVEHIVPRHAHREALKNRGIFPQYNPLQSFLIEPWSRNNQKKIKAVAFPAKLVGLADGLAEHLRKRNDSTIFIRSWILIPLIRLFPVPKKKPLYHGVAKCIRFPYIHLWPPSRTASTSVSEWSWVQTRAVHLFRGEWPYSQATLPSRWKPALTSRFAASIWDASRVWAADIGTLSGRVEKKRKRGFLYWVLLSPELWTQTPLLPRSRCREILDGLNQTKQVRLFFRGRLCVISMEIALF